MRDLANSTITIKQCISEDSGSIPVGLLTKFFVYLSHSAEKIFSFFLSSFLPSSSSLIISPFATPFYSFVS